MTRRYACQNQDCPNFALFVEVRGRDLGLFWEFPVLVCMCGVDAAITHQNGQPVT